MLICLYGIGVDAVPGAAIVGVWLYCLLWLVASTSLKLVYWRLADRRERDLKAGSVRSRRLKERE